MKEQPKTRKQKIYSLSKKLGGKVINEWIKVPSFEDTSVEKEAGCKTHTSRLLWKLTPSLLMNNICFKWQERDPSMQILSRKFRWTEQHANNVLSLTTISTPLFFLNLKY